MLDIKERIASFPDTWPYQAADNCSCTPQAMAEAGFYWCGSTEEPDAARCYFCRKELDGWEPEDDPWAEHKKRHNCAFIGLGKKQSELTVADMWGVIVPGRLKSILDKEHQEWKGKYEEKCDQVREEIEKMGPLRK